MRACKHVHRYALLKPDFVCTLCDAGAISSSNAPLQKYQHLRLWDDNEIRARGPMFTPMTMRMSRGNAAFQSAFGAFENAVDRLKRKDTEKQEEAERPSK